MLCCLRSTKQKTFRMATFVAILCSVKHKKERSANRRISGCMWLMMSLIRDQGQWPVIQQENKRCQLKTLHYWIPIYPAKQIYPKNSLVPYAISKHFAFEKFVRWLKYFVAKQVRLPAHLNSRFMPNYSLRSSTTFCLNIILLENMIS